jgi:Spy/CpxP family protein refolding chaperone
MKKVVGIAMVLALAAGTAPAGQPQPQSQPPAGTGTATGPGVTERIRDLNLTDAQEADIAAIREEYAPKVEQAVTQLQTAVKEARDAARDVLTAEQKTKLAAMKEEGKTWKYETMAERVAHLRDLDLTDEEMTKLASIRKEYRPKIVEALESLKGTLTPEQAKMREEGLKAGKSRREVIASLNLSNEQKQQVEAVGEQVRALVREELNKMRDVLNPEQREKLATMKEDRREQIRGRALFAIESLKELNLTDEQKTQLKAVQMEYGPRIEEAGNQVRAVVREEIRAIIGVIKA